MNTEHDDFTIILDMIKERLEQWGEGLNEQGWRGTVGLLIEGDSEDSEWVAPLIGGSINLERGEDHSPEQYDAEDEYRYGTDDSEYPVNEINELLMTYTGTEPYWYDIVMRIHPEDGVRLRVVG